MTQVLFEVSINGRSAVKVTINPAVAVAIWQAAMAEEGQLKVVRSAPMSTEQAQALLNRIDPKSRVFLRRIADNGGSATWAEMRDIFGIEEWSEYSSSFGKGITRAFRNITGQEGARLVDWDDDDKAWTALGMPDGRVYVDGPALEALRAATKVA